MGVDTKFLTNTTVNAENIMTALKAMGMENVEYRPTHTPNYSQITFKSRLFKGNSRILHFFHSSTEEIGVPMNSMSLSSDNESTEILATLANMFGGLFQATDDTDDWEAYKQPGSGNIRWLLDQYFAKAIHAPLDADNQIEDFIEFVKERK